MKILIGFACFIVVCLFAGLFDFLYVRIKRNRRRIGPPPPSCSVLSKTDSVCFGRRVYEFDHFSDKKEASKSPDFDVSKLERLERILAFRQVESNDYLYLPESALKDCTYICNKNGVKWAIDEERAEAAMERAKFFYE